VTQLITALISIHSSMTFLADMYSFLDPPGRTVLFSVDDCSLFPVDCIICLIRMVGECWLAIFHQTGCALTSGKSSFGLGLNFSFMFMLPLTLFQFLLHTSCYSWHKEPCIYILLSSLSCLSFGCTNKSSNVFQGFMTTGTLCLFIILTMASETFSTYRIMIIGLFT